MRLPNALTEGLNLPFPIFCLKGMCWSFLPEHQTKLSGRIVLNLFQTRCWQVRAAWTGQHTSQLHTQDPDAWSWVVGDTSTPTRLPHPLPVPGSRTSWLHLRQRLGVVRKGGLAPATSTTWVLCLQVLRELRDHLQAESGGISLQPVVVLPRQHLFFPSVILQVQVTHLGPDTDPTAGERGATF